jgi:hypothetical protein
MSFGIHDYSDVVGTFGDLPPWSLISFTTTPESNLGPVSSDNQYVPTHSYTEDLPAQKSGGGLTAAAAVVAALAAYFLVVRR